MALNKFLREVWGREKQGTKLLNIQKTRPEPQEQKIEGCNDLDLCSVDSEK